MLPSHSLLHLKSSIVPKQGPNTDFGLYSCDFVSGSIWRKIWVEYSCSTCLAAWLNDCLASFPAHVDGTKDNDTTLSLIFPTRFLSSGSTTRWLQGSPAGRHASQVLRVGMQTCKRAMACDCGEHESTASGFCGCWIKKHWAWVLQTKLGDLLAGAAKHSNASRPHAITVTAKVWACHSQAKPLRDCFFCCRLHIFCHGSVSVVTADVVLVAEFSLFWFAVFIHCPWSWITEIPFVVKSFTDLAGLDTVQHMVICEFVCISGRLSYVCSLMIFFLSDITWLHSYIWPRWHIKHELLIAASSCCPLPALWWWGLCCVILTPWLR